ncbi:hypothetical protein HMPREF9394_1784 [Streptococcus sanguinis SK1057]|nr:hypothetical protein HMPREF9394_1784 [Streptococcus sanguinis SK1057]
MFFYFTSEYFNPFNLPIIADLALFFNYLRKIKNRPSERFYSPMSMKFSLKSDNDTVKGKIPKSKIKTSK